MPLLDQEHARAGLEAFLDQEILLVGQSKARDVVLRRRLVVREKDFGRRLLDECAGDGTCEHIARALRRERRHPLELAPSLEAILRESLERWVR